MKIGFTQGILFTFILGITAQPHYAHAMESTDKTKNNEPELVLMENIEGPFILTAGIGLALHLSTFAMSYPALSNIMKHFGLLPKSKLISHLEVAGMLISIIAIAYGVLIIKLKLWDGPKNSTTSFDLNNRDEITIFHYNKGEKTILPFEKLKLENPNEYDKQLKDFKSVTLNFPEQKTNEQKDLLKTIIKYEQNKYEQNKFV